MAKIKNEQLLNDPRVMEEISRHRWLESEKAHEDIGYEKASAEWLNNFSDTWLKANSPKVEVAKSAKPVAAAKPAAKSAKPVARSAKRTK